ALQEAARLAFGLPARPSAKEMIALAEPWRPLRAVAARVLWTYYRAIKGREGVPTPTLPSPASGGGNGGGQSQAKPKRTKAKRGGNGR
ncbi:MAG: hypothetical protein WBD80_11900, partial [Xanthobacteraceae bacterium]